VEQTEGMEGIGRPGILGRKLGSLSREPESYSSPGKINSRSKDEIGH
jgi:hypothetical protein